jgi:predicted nucleic acid-binding protein
MAEPVRSHLMIHLDTSVLIDALTGTRRSSGDLRELLAGPEPIAISSIVLFEWFRGPRLDAEIEAQETLFPSADSAPFGFLEARIASHLYKVVRRPRGREADLAVAACALASGASLWTLNDDDFDDIPNLTLWRPGA